MQTCHGRHNRTLPFRIRKKAFRSNFLSDQTVYHSLRRLTRRFLFRTIYDMADARLNMRARRIVPSAGVVLPALHGALRHLRKTRNHA